MQRLSNLLLVMMLYLASSTSSAQQFENFRHVGEINGMAAGTVTSITLAPTTSQISYFDAAGLHSLFDVILEPSQVIRQGLPAFMPPAEFSVVDDSMNLTGVSFYTGTLVNTKDRQGEVPTHWFRITYHDGLWSGAFRIADRIYVIDRSSPDNVVAVRDTPSTNDWLQPTKQIKVTALIDDTFVLTHSDGTARLGHVHALESLHVLDGVMNDSLGITLKLEQLIYQPSTELTSPADWLAGNESAFGIDDNYATFIFQGNTVTRTSTDDNANNLYALQGNTEFSALTTARNFGTLVGLPIEAGTLQSMQSPLPAAHWSESQKQYLDANLPKPALVQITSSDAPPIAVTEPEPINEIPQHILDSESVESSDNNSEPSNTGGDSSIPDNSGNAPGLQSDPGLQNDPGSQDDITTPAADTSGGGATGIASLLLLLMLVHCRRRLR